MADDIGRWLEERGLGRYADVFAENEIDLNALPHIADEDLEKIGVALGARRKILAAVTDRSTGVAIADAEVTAEPDAVSGRRDSERRQVSVLFCDLVGSTALSGRLDAEDYRAVIRAYEETCREVAERYDGHVANISGDGALMSFGYPRAHEDDAERAVRAGLELVRAVGDLRPLPNVALQARAGVATGLVVTEQGMISGETPALAARLQTIAKPGAAVIADSTRRLIGDLFELKDLGQPALKGIGERHRVWRAVAERVAESRFEAARAAGVTPFVGRDEELDLLLRRYEQAKDGEGQVVFLSGEAGIGKSRLVQRLQERIATEAYTRLRYQCSPFHTNSALYPAIRQLELAAGFAADETPAQKLDKLEVLLTKSDDNVDDVAPLLAALLSIPADDRYPPIDMTPQRQKDETLQALVEQLIGLARRRPVLFLLEDVHWIDPTTRELVALTVDRVQEASVLAVITFRPEFVPPWTGHTHITTLALNRLGRRHTTEIVAKVTGGKALPDSALDQIVAKTDGVPLFVEELTKAVLESDQIIEGEDRYELTGLLSTVTIPASLHDSLMARLDRLGSIKELAQVGAVIGRTFSYELLAAVASMPGDRLRLSLDELVASELVFARGSPPQATYIFKHALVQDAAYQSLLKSRRRELHDNIATVLEDRFPQTVETEPELLALHMTEAGRIEKAVTYWYSAGRRALARSAFVEAMAHFDRGLESIAHLPSDPSQDRRELELQLARGAVWIAYKGWASTEAGEAFTRAHVLAQQLNSRVEQLESLRGLTAHTWVRGDLRSAREQAERFIILARQIGEKVNLDTGHMLLGGVLAWQGEFSDAAKSLEQVIGRYNREDHRASIQSVNLDPGVNAMAHFGWTLCMLGFLDRASDSSEQAVMMARKLNQPFSLAQALRYSSIVCILTGQWKNFEEIRAEVEETVAKNRLGQYEPYLIHMNAVALIAKNQHALALSELQRARSSYQTSQATLFFPMVLSLQASVCGRIGRPEDGLKKLSEAIVFTDKHSMRYMDAELHRLRGELLLMRSDSHDAAEAEASFHESLDVARRQKAKSWELRAATSLARLWHDQGKAAEARDLLAPVYDWFTEGFDTADLKDAKALLDELS